MPSTAQRASALILRSSLWRASSSSAQIVSRQSSKPSNPCSRRRSRPRSIHRVARASARRKARSWLIRTKALRVSLQLALQPFDRLDVEMVGRLVEQHQLGRLGHQPRQRRAPPLAARGGGDRGGGIEAQPLGRDRQAIVLARRQSWRRHSRQAWQRPTGRGPAPYSRHGRRAGRCGRRHRARPARPSASSASICPSRCARPAPAGRRAGPRDRARRRPDCRRR